MKTTLNTLAACALLACSSAAFATDMTAASSMSSPAPHMDANGVEMSSGEVKKIDKAAQKITLKHGELKNLDMPGMTMVFSVKDAALLDKVKAGDKVKFTAEDQGGALVVTAIEALQ